MDQSHKTPSYNTVQLGDDGIMYVSLVGDQTQQSITKTAAQTKEIDAVRRAQGQKILTLIDTNRMGKHTSSARVAAKEVMRQIEFDATAIVGHNHLLPLVMYILRGAGVAPYKVRYFKNKNAATAWLANPSVEGSVVKQLRHLSFTAWGMIVLLIVIVVATFLAWKQSDIQLQEKAETVFNNETGQTADLVASRMQTYTNTLYGFRGLFHSSQSVSAAEFLSYYQSLNIAKDYPGFRSINFVKRVKKDELPAYLESMRSQTGNPHLTITPATEQDEYYTVTYVSTELGIPGTDLRHDPERRRTLERARDTGEPAATDTLSLLAADGTHSQIQGFFLTLPVYNADRIPATIEERQEKLTGFINAVFSYDSLFGDLFRTLPAELQVGIHDTDAAHSAIYTKTSESKADKTQQRDLMIGNHSWVLEVKGPQYFGLSPEEQASPSRVLFSGLGISGLIAFALYRQFRSRRDTLLLAEDITKDLQRERNRAIALKNKSDTIVSSIGDGVFAIDRTGTIILFNHAAELISGFSAQEALGKPYKTILRFKNEKDESLVDAFIKTALSGKKAEMARHTLLMRKDGNSVPVADSAAPISDAQHHIDGAVVVFRDTTQARQLEQMKDEFLSVASHELRTPMGAIRANVSMILAGDYGPVSKELREPLEDMHTSAIRLVELVSDLLNIARIEAGRMKFQLEECDIQAIIQQTTTSLAPLGKEKGIEIINQKSDPLMVQADPEKIRQILINLIGNAIKFTDKGRISVAAKPADSTVEVTVSDTGIGISPEDQTKLFGKFKQITSAQDGKPAGTGLGLYISREIARKMGGEMWIKSSTPGKGSVLAFTIPLSGSLIANRIRQQIEREAQLHPDQK